MMYMKKVLPALMLTAILLGGYSCSKDSEDTNVSITSGDVKLSNAINQTSLEVTTNSKWNISGVPEWITVNPSSGSGNTTVQISVSEITSSNGRSATLTLNAGGKTKSILVVQDAPELKLLVQDFEFNAAGTPQQMVITSNSSWKIIPSPDASWCTFEPMQGRGNGTVTMTPKPIVERLPRPKTIIKVAYGSAFAQPVISQLMPNTPPTAPQITMPNMDETVSSVMPRLQWIASTDPDGDKLTYTVNISTSADSWATGTTYNEIASTSFTPKSMLKKSTKHYWRVVAKDPFGGTAESTVSTFTTGNQGGYADGEVRLYQNNTHGSTPVNLVVLGDGFIAEDYNDGAAFDKAADEAIEAFLSVEPYPTYRDYFKVQKVAAYSVQRGANVKAEGLSVNTAFKSTLDGGNSTGIECDYDHVFEYAKKASGITESALTKMTVILVININRYAGTCAMFNNGKSVSMTPIDRSSSDGFKKLVSHEAGGHGFGRLCDEYRYYKEQIPATEKEDRMQWQGWGYYQNISFTNDPNQIPWRAFIGYSGYGAVGAFEGGALYEKGVWRPEQNSCMNNNIPYYNVASRYAIYDRLKRAAGETASFADFVSRDRVKVNPYTSRTRSPEVFRPLAPPIMIKVK